MREKTIMDRLSWKNTGFSVYMESKIEYTIYNESERGKLEQMLRYISKPFFSMQKIIFNENSNTVLYRGEYNPSIKQNFQTFSAEDFIAALTSHIPNHRQRYVNYYAEGRRCCKVCCQVVFALLHNSIFIVFFD